MWLCTSEASAKAQFARSVKKGGDIWERKKKDHIAVDANTSLRLSMLGGRNYVVKPLSIRVASVRYAAMIAVSMRLNFITGMFCRKNSAYPIRGIREAGRASRMN